MLKIASSICDYFEVDLEKIKNLSPYLLALNLIYFFPLLVQNIPYMDDLEWSVTGSPGHLENGRPLGDYLSSILSFNFNFSNNSLFDSGSFLQIFSITLLTFVACIFYLRINDKEPSLYLAMLIFSFLVNPVCLLLLSYRLSCFHGALSISLSLLACLKLRNRPLGLFISSLFILASLCIYQPSINIFISASFLLFLIEYKKSVKDSLILLLDNSLKLFSAILIYKFIILSNIHHFKGYFQQRSSIFKLDQNFFTNIYEHGLSLLDQFLNAFSDSKIIILFSIISILAYGFQYIFFENNKRISSFFIYIFCVSGMGFGIIGFMAFMPSVRFLPRTFIGFSILLVFIFYAFDQSIVRWAPSLKVVVFIPLLYFTFISFSYNRIIEVQYEYQSKVVNSIIENLTNLGLKPWHTVYARGYLEYSPVGINSKSKNKLLSSLLNKSDNIGGVWYTSIFLKYSGLKAKILSWDDAKKLLKADVTCNHKALYTSQFYKITRINNDIFIITFPQKSCFNQIH